LRESGAHFLREVEKNVKRHTFQERFELKGKRSNKSAVHISRRGHASQGRLQQLMTGSYNSRGLYIMDLERAVQLVMHRN
jgi:hypothetical protein